MNPNLKPTLLAALALCALAVAPPATADTDPFPDQAEAVACGFPQVSGTLGSLPPEAGRCVDSAPPTGADDYQNPLFAPCTTGCDTLTDRNLLHQTGIGIQSVELPPEDVMGVPLPNHPGVGPFTTDPVGEDIGTLSTRDNGDNYCMYFTPDGGSEQLLFCVGRAFLVGPLDAEMPRGDQPLISYNPPNVPGTGPITTPDVPPTPAGSLGDTPAMTVDVDVTYSYSADRLQEFVNVAGQQSWAPVGPMDLPWLLSPSNEASLRVSVTLYQDGVSQGTVEREVPALGQVLAAAEATAGSL